MRIWKSKLFCILFHPIREKKGEWYYDEIMRRWFGKYKCDICGRKFVARYGRDWYRLYKRDYKNIKK